MVARVTFWVIFGVMVVYFNCLRFFVIMKVSQRLLLHLVAFLNTG